MPNITDEDVATYERDGVVCLRGAIDAKWIEKLRAGVESDLREPGPHVEVYVRENQPGNFTNDFDLWRHIPELKSFVFDGPCAEISGKLMRARRINFFCDQLFVKEPGALTPTYWHQDQPFMAVNGAGTKNILAFAFMIPTFWLFGWWIYLAMTNDFIPDFAAGAGGVPWGESMGPNLTDNASGVFWAAFTLFACTTASIMSGSVIERIRMAAFIVLAVFLGSVVWILAAAWGWHPDGWMVSSLGYHDFGASGVVHIISGFFALGVLIHLGPRIGKYAADGAVNIIRGHSVPMSIVGLMLIVCGFFGFLGGCAIYYGTGQWTSIYGSPTTLSGIVFNILMGVAGGVIGAWFKTRDPFWMMSGALCGIISVSGGMDIYFPGLTFALAFFGGVTGPIVAGWLERRGIDDAVGAVAVHGYCGILGVLFVGLFITGYPTHAEGIPPITFYGQFVGMLVMVALGFIPGYCLAWILKKAGVLRASDGVQEIGMDVELTIPAYPEDIRTPQPLTGEQHV